MKNEKFVNRLITYKKTNELINTIQAIKIMVKK